MSALADVLAAHHPVRWSDDWWECSCREASRLVDQFGLHVEEAVAAAGLAVIPRSVIDGLRGIADDVRADIKVARADGDQERRSYLRGELQGILSAYDFVLGAAEQVTV